MFDHHCCVKWLTVWPLLLCRMVKYRKDGQMVDNSEKASGNVELVDLLACQYGLYEKRLNSKNSGNEVY